MGLHQEIGLGGGAQEALDGHGSKRLVVGAFGGRKRGLDRAGMGPS